MALTSPAGTVSQPIGKPFYGQAKGLLWLTWRSYAGPPQYFIPPEDGALNPSGRRQPVPDRTLAAQGQRPGGWLNLHARKGVSTFGNTGVSVKFSSVIHLTVNNYYLRGFGLISISVSLWQVFPLVKKKLHKCLYVPPGIPAYSFSFYASAPHSAYS